MLEKRDAAALQQLNSLSQLAQEAGRQGARRVSERLNIKVEAEDGKADIIARAEIAKRFSFKDVMAASIYTEVKGELPGASFVLIPRDNALRIIAGATGARPDRPVSLSAFTPQYVLKQIGESFARTYFEGIAIYLQRPARVRMTAPEVIFDAWDTTLNTMAQRLPARGDRLYTFWLRFSFTIGDERCQGVQLYFIEQGLLPATN
jgi:hypothetical protein